jgi:hypothetical protein
LTITTNWCSAVDEHEKQLRPFERTVKPRRRTYKRLPVIAVGTSYFLTESGETGTIPNLIDTLPEYPPTLFVTVGSSGDFVAMLESCYIPRTPGAWRWRIVPQEKSMFTVGGFMRPTRAEVPVNYFGWRAPGSYHKAIDPITFCGQKIGDVWPDEVTVVASDPEWRLVRKLLAWATAIRDFCDENGMEVRSTQGSIAAQFLTDPRFYPHARRKVPHVINDRAREHLPGNHYFLNVAPAPSNNFTAHYLDQHSAHHYHAQTTPLPDSNHCFAFGRFLDLAPAPPLRIDPDFMGLYCLDLSAPANRPAFDWIGNGLAERIGDTLDVQFIYSNELQHLLDVGYRVRAVRAAWGSVKRDTGIARYAHWATEQLDKYNGAAWLKPILLATYGVLATRPMNRQSVFRTAKKGVPVEIRTGRRQLNGLLVQNPRKLEPGVAHIIQRGMIEAVTRSETIGLAQWLDYLGHTVLSLYADAVIVEADDDRPLPALPEPWRLKKTLNHLQFINTQAFQSDGMTKLPGVSKEAMAYRQMTMPGRAPRIQRDLMTGKATSRRI